MASVRTNSDASVLEDFSVGECRIYPSENLVRCDGQPVQLEPKAMALLVYLAQHAGCTLSREQLFAAVWPGVIVSDDTLTQAVTKLRKAFRDNAKIPRYIQTVPKAGYRLTAPVRFASDRVAAPQAGSKHRLRGFLIAALLLIGSVGALFILADRFERGLPERKSPAPTVPDELPTLTVAPFTLLGEDGSQAYLAQGLTYDLITDLSKLSGLLVIGSRSIMGQRLEPTAVHPASYRVQGEVQRIDQELRVHVHLFDARTGRQIWSERYRRPVDKLFQLQEAISREIVASLSIKVNEEEMRRLARPYTVNVHAYELFLQGQSLLLTRQRADNEQARQLFRQAIDLDPSFARAYGGLALSFAADYRNQWATDGAAAMQSAQAMARTALEIDPEIPEVFWVLAYVSTQRRQHDQAIGLLRKAISIDQSFADAYALLGGINTYIGRPAESLGLMRTAIRLNPGAGYLYHLLLGRAYFFLDDMEQATINLQEALDRNSTNLEARVYLAAVRESSGDHEAALWEREEILALDAGFQASEWLRTYPMSDAAQAERLLNALTMLQL
jgi:DNA-binding winged helix-turn-helix (wHTH) protein/TolB-like protein/Tfp pilus assembly protein PilF